MKMHKFTFLTLLLFLATFFSCSKEDDTFDYPLDDLYGTWDGSAVKIDGSWIDITSWIYSKYQFSIAFYEDGTYYGSGYFGNGYGTYTAIGDTITTYVDGEKYFIYTINSLYNDVAEATMSSDSSDSTIEIKVERQ